MNATPTIAETYLADFIKRNDHVSLSSDKDQLVVEKAWSTTSVTIKCSLSDTTFFSDLNNIIFNPIFDAILHADSNQVEFFCGYLDPDDDDEKYLIDYRFRLYYSGAEFECGYYTPTDRFLRLAARTTVSPGAGILQQLRAFRDSQFQEELNSEQKKYFASKLPRNFFLRSQTDVTKIDLISISRNLNFIMDYYDRGCPEIELREHLVKSEDKYKPMRFLNGRVPDSFSIQKMDEICLQLNHVARRSPTRQAFLYYYQVIEYAGHYFIDDKIRSQIRKFLRDPNLMNCDDRKIAELYALLTDTLHNDDEKMRRVMEDVIDPSILWKEIEHDKDFFAKEISFEGGFTLPALISKDCTPEAWASMWSPKLYSHLTKIRNCLVHARERRENKVILPTTSNGRVLRHYIPIIQRVAQLLALASRG